MIQVWNSFSHRIKTAKNLELLNPQGGSIKIDVYL